MEELNESGVDARVDKVALRKRLAGQMVGNRLMYFIALASTNDHARELAEDGWPEGTVVMSEEQTSGKGRSGKEWHSPPGVGLYFSVLLKPELAPAKVPLLTLLMAVSAARALNTLGLPVKIKWPNDLILGGRKIGGILADSRMRPNGKPDVIIGMGLNVNNSLEDFPSDISAKAGSIKLVTGVAVDRTEVMTRILISINESYTRLRESGEHQLLDEFKQLSPMVQGRKVTIIDGDRTYKGVTSGLSASGALNVNGPNGMQEIYVGEVSVSEESDAVGC